MNNIVAIIQARSGSTRLQNKIFADICGKPLIFHVVDRLKHSKRLNDIIIATTENANDNSICDWALANNIKCFRGDEHNVLNRYYETAVHYGINNIVRITADDPFKDPLLLDDMIDYYFRNDADLLTNNAPPTFPEGMDMEIFSFNALEKAEKNVQSDFQKEHVTQYFYQNKNQFSIENYSQSIDRSFLRWTIDTQEDLDMVRMVYKELYKPSELFISQAIYTLIDKYPFFAKMNQLVPRSYMYSKG